LFGGLLLPLGPARALGRQFTSFVIGNPREYVRNVSMHEGNP
jgi:hypothetical protein